MTVEHDPAAKDRSRITCHGKSSLGRMLCRTHVWRCIADVESCRELYEPLNVVDDE